MPLFSPRRYQAPFRPVRPSDDGPFRRAINALERWVKGPLFGCRMCGNCILRETAYVCPMTCPKGLRNGLCGGATPEACEVDPSRPCTWYVIHRRARRWGWEERLLEVNAPLDGSRVGRGTWGTLFRSWRERGGEPRLRDAVLDRERFREELASLLREVRQPGWWQGDGRPHPPAYEAPLSALEANLRTRDFVVTGEIAPPLGPGPGTIVKKAEWLKGRVVAANFTDNASASARMSSLASSRICLEGGLEPIMQLQARDRTRVALTSDALGAAGLGIVNILCLSGDHHRFGPGAMAKPDQFDLDSIQLLWMLRRMRDEGVCLDGRELKERPRFFLGAAASPFGPPPAYEAIRLEVKANAGAQFIQTQPVFDLERFGEWLEALERRGVHGRVPVLAGVLPLKSARAAAFMAREVPGVVVPPGVLKRMEEAGGKEGEESAGFDIALETLERLRATPGIRGVHIMAVHWEAVIPRLVEAAGLPAPMPFTPGKEER